MGAVPFTLTLLDAAGSPYVSGEVDFFIKGTNTPQPAYTDVGLTTPATNPLTADAAGRIEAYLDDTLDYTIEAYNADRSDKPYEIDYTSGAVAPFNIKQANLRDANTFIESLDLDYAAVEAVADIDAEVQIVADNIDVVTGAAQVITDLNALEAQTGLLRGDGTASAIQSVDVPELGITKIAGLQSELDDLLPIADFNANADGWVNTADLPAGRLTGQIDEARTANLDPGIDAVSPSKFDTLANAVTQFLSTTTTAGAQLANVAQQPLYVPKGKHTFPDIVITGTGQWVNGDGSASNMTTGGIAWDGNFDRGGVFGLMLSGAGVGTFGLRVNDDDLRFHTAAMTHIRDREIGFDAGSITWGSMTANNIEKCGTGVRLGDVVGWDWANVQITTCADASVKMQDNTSVGELRMVNVRIQQPTDGPAMDMRAQEGNWSESYLTNVNFNQGSHSDDVTITAITSYNGGAQIQVDHAAAHKCQPGWIKYYLESADYADGEYTVAEVLSPTSLVLDLAYTSDSTGTFKRQYPGLWIADEGSASRMVNMRDLQFYNGASNNTEVEGAYALTFANRGGGAKERFWVERASMVLRFGVMVGRRDVMQSSIPTAGPGSHTGVGEIGMYDEGTDYQPGNQYVALKMPNAADGVGSDNLPVAMNSFEVDERGEMRFKMGDQLAKFHRANDAADMALDLPMNIEASPSAVRAWGRVDASGALVASHNVTSVTTLDGERTGRRRVTYVGNVADNNTDTIPIVVSAQINRAARIVTARIQDGQFDFDTEDFSGSANSAAVTFYVVGKGGTV